MARNTGGWEGKYHETIRQERRDSIQRELQNGTLKIYTPKEVRAFARARNEAAASTDVLREAVKKAKAG